MAAGKTFLGIATDLTNQTTYDFGNFTSATNGVIVIMFWGQGGTAQTVNSVSIGGVAATIAANHASNVTKCCVAYLSVAAGTFDVSVTMSGANGTSPTARVGVWLVTGVNATPFATPAVSAFTSATTASVTPNTAASGIGLFASAHLANTAISWNHATNDNDSQVGSAAERMAFASLATSAETPHTETATWTTTSGSFAMGITFQSGDVGEALGLAQEVLTSFALTEATDGVAETLAPALAILTSFALTEGLSLNDTLAVAQEILTAYGFTGSIVTPPPPVGPARGEAPALRRSRVNPGSLSKIRSVSSALRATRVNGSKLDV